MISLAADTLYISRARSWRASHRVLRPYHTAGYFRDILQPVACPLRASKDTVGGDSKDKAAALFAFWWKLAQRVKIARTFLQFGQKDCTLLFERRNRGIAIPLGVNAFPRENNRVAGGQSSLNRTRISSTVPFSVFNEASARTPPRLNCVTQSK